MNKTSSEHISNNYPKQKVLFSFYITFLFFTISGWPWYFFYSDAIILNILVPLSITTFAFSIAINFKFFFGINLRFPEISKFKSIYSRIQAQPTNGDDFESIELGELLFDIISSLNALIHDQHLKLKFSNCCDEVNVETSKKMVNREIHNLLFGFGQLIQGRPSKVRVIEIKLQASGQLDIILKGFELHQELLWELWCLPNSEKISFDQIFDEIEDCNHGVALKNHYNENGQCLYSVISIDFLNKAKIQIQEAA
ncbi:MAG: hypothetical protein ACOCUH_02160 [Bacteriovoracia bacterium]